LTCAARVGAVALSECGDRKGESGGEIDGSAPIATRRPLRAGDVVTVKIDRADAYDLWGTAV
jgi:TRAM domain-containing protein